jgi:hypothetical protein
MLAGHYLGVDHAGHAHGVASAAMADKLAQMDDQIAYVAGMCLLCQHQKVHREWCSAAKPSMLPAMQLLMNHDPATALH